jgi:hypothetical protein
MPPAGRAAARFKPQDMLVETMAEALLDGGSTPPASTSILELNAQPAYLASSYGHECITDYTFCDPRGGVEPPSGGYLLIDNEFTGRDNFSYP